MKKIMFSMALIIAVVASFAFKGAAFTNNELYKKIGANCDNTPVCSSVGTITCSEPISTPLYDANCNLFTGTRYIP